MSVGVMLAAIGVNHHIGEQDAGRVVLGGDGPLLRLQRLGNLRRQDIEEQHLRSFLEEIPLADEVVEQREGDRDHSAEVEHEEQVTKCPAAAPGEVGLEHRTDEEERTKAMIHRACHGNPQQGGRPADTERPR